jgi:hypothetical protein
MHDFRSFLDSRGALSFRRRCGPIFKRQDARFLKRPSHLVKLLLNPPQRRPRVALR